MIDTGRAVAIVLGLWFVIALAIGASGLYCAIPTPLIGATNGLLVILTLLAGFCIRPLRAWASEVPLQWLVGYHVVRFVGIACLVFHARGVIPAEFAITAWEPDPDLHSAARPRDAYTHLRAAPGDQPQHVTRTQSLTERP